MQRPTSTEASPVPTLSDQEWAEWRESHPPIAGADDGEQPSGSAPTPEPAAAPAAPASGTSGSDAPTTPAEESITPFSIAEVPEEYREHVERYNRQIQGAFTRKTQELAAQRQAIADTIALHEALGNDDTRDETIRRLMAENGYEVEEEETPPGTPDPGAPTTETPSEIERRLAAIEADQEARREAAEQADRESYAAQVADAVKEGLEAYRTAEKLDKVSDSTRQTITALARSLPPVEVDGVLLPNMEAAIELHKANAAEDLQRYLRSKDTPTPELGGVAGTPKFNPRNDRERLALANQIAGRHLG